MTELLKSCRNRSYRRTLLGPMERSRRGYSFTDLVPCLTDPFGRLRHLRPHPLLLPPPPPPPPPPPVILHPQFMPSVRSPSISAPRGQSCPATSKSQRTRRSIYSTDHSRDEVIQTISDSIRFCTAEISAALYRVPLQTRCSLIAVPIGKLQALLSCLSAPQVCAASTAVKLRRRILQTSLLCLTLSLKSCLALPWLPLQLCAVVIACVSSPQKRP